MDFPLMLYRPDGSMLEWDGALWDTVIVNDEEEAEIALADGYGLPGEEISPAPAKRGRPKKEASE